MNIRFTTAGDVPFIVNSLRRMINHIHTCGSNPYSNHLPTHHPDIRKTAMEYIDQSHAVGLIAAVDGSDAGVLLGMIQASNMPFCIREPVGYISICWVDENHRNNGIASQLVADAEKWFASKQVKLVELSYFAQNVIAETSWKKLGYNPFRVHAYKELGQEIS